MLRDDVWLRITSETGGAGVLCRADIERRLGRPLTEADMMDESGTLRLTDEAVDAMRDGDFYRYMLDKDATEWARQANRRGGMGLDKRGEEVLTVWIANAMCAVDDRKELEKSPNPFDIRNR